MKTAFIIMGLFVFIGFAILLGSSASKRHNAVNQYGTKEYAYQDEFANKVRVIVIDNCEYLWAGDEAPVHKQNCKNPEHEED